MLNTSEATTPTMTDERPIVPDSTHSNEEQETMNSSASNTPTQQDTANTPFTTLHPHAHDVLCGRGGAVNHHPGNVKFRKLVRQRKKEYLELPLKDNRKTLIIQDIVVRVKSQDPPGKFLSKNAKGEWVEIDDALAAHKTRQALRERDNSSGVELLAEDLHSMRAAAMGGQKRSLDSESSTAERPLKKARNMASDHEETIPELALPPPAMDEMVPPLTFDRYGYIVPPVDTQIPYLTPEGWFTPTTMTWDSSGISPSNAITDIPKIAEDTAKLVEQSIDDDDAPPVATPPKSRRKKKKKGERTYDAPIFLQKTYHMVEHCDDPSVLSWSDDGTMMVIKDTAKLGAEIIPKYFRHNKFTSFVRQLNFYGFHKVKSTEILVRDESHDNKNHWVFCHAKFQRGRPDLLHEISKKAQHDSDAPSKEEFNALQQEMKELKSYIANNSKKKEMRQSKAEQWSPRHSSLETLSLKKEVGELKMRVANLEKLVTFLGQSSEGTSGKSGDKRDRSKVYDLEYVPGVRGNQHSCV